MKCFSAMFVLVAVLCVGCETKTEEKKVASAVPPAPVITSPTTGLELPTDGHSAVVSNNGAFMAVATRKNVLVYDLNRGRLTKKIETGLNHPQLIFSDSGRYLVINAKGLNSKEDIRDGKHFPAAFFILWDTEDETMTRHTDGGMRARISFSPDERYLCVGIVWTDKFNIYNTPKGTLCTRLKTSFPFEGVGFYGTPSKYVVHAYAEGHQSHIDVKYGTEVNPLLVAAPVEYYE